MKILLMLMALVVSTTSFAGDIDDVFDRGETEFEFERFSDNGILLAIDEDAELACENGLCTLHSVTNRYGGFEVSFNVGEGNPNSSGNGTITNIYTDNKPEGNCNTCEQAYWGITLRYRKGKCTQRINVPRSVYYAINRYMYGLMTEEGGTRRGFTPADEAMIMFYTTIMSKATGCTLQ